MIYYDYDYDYLNSFLKDKSYVYVTSITKDYVDMAHNWFLSLKRINQEHLALVGALDQESFKEMTSLNIPCVFLDVRIDSNSSFSDWVENEKFYKLSLPAIIYEYHKTNMILSDIDVFFLKDPIKKLEEEIKDYDYLVMSDRRFDPFLTQREKNILKTINYNKTEILNYGLTPQAKYGIMNGGFSYFKPNTPNHEKVADACRVFFKNSKELEKYPKGIEEGSLQNISIKRFEKYDININILNCFEFVNGSIIQIPYLKNKIIDNAFLFHYNFVDEDTPLNMKKSKINLMKENNHWLL